MSQGRRESNAVLRRWCAAIKGDVLSVGSSSDGDGEGQTYREYFASAASYTTSDVTPGCDRVLDVRAMPQVTFESFDAVFASGVLEHVDDFRAAVREIWRVLRRDGMLLVGVPFNQPIHREPNDFWRFTRHALPVVLDGFRIQEIATIGDEPHPSAYWVKAQKVIQSAQRRIY